LALGIVHYDYSVYSSRKSCSINVS
jgi:hypothetical protein